MKELKEKIREIIQESREHDCPKCYINLPGKYHKECYEVMEELKEEGLFNKYLDAELVIGSHHPENIYDDYTITIPDPNTSLIIIVIF